MATVVRDALLPITTCIRDAQIILIDSTVVLRPVGGMATTQTRVITKTDHQATPGTSRNRRRRTGRTSFGPFLVQQHGALHKSLSPGYDGNLDNSTTVLS